MNGLIYCTSGPFTASLHHVSPDKAVDAFIQAISHEFGIATSSPDLDPAIVAEGHPNYVFQNQYVLLRLAPTNARKIYALRKSPGRGRAIRGFSCFLPEMPPKTTEVKVGLCESGAKFPHMERIYEVFREKFGDIVVALYPPDGDETYRIELLAYDYPTPIKDMVKAVFGKGVYLYSQSRREVQANQTATSIIADPFRAPPTLQPVREEDEVDDGFIEIGQTLHAMDEAYAVLVAANTAFQNNCTVDNGNAVVRAGAKIAEIHRRYREL